MKKVYVVRTAADWDYDFVEICSTLKEVANLIYEYMEEEEGVYVDTNELENHMKEREKEGWEFLIDEEFNGGTSYFERVGWAVQKREH